MNAIKGYVVRGIGTSSERTLWAMHGGLLDGLLADSRAEAAEYATIGEAIGALPKMAYCRDVTILAISGDGTETPLPSYEEALAALATVRDEAQKALDDKGPAKGMSAAPPELGGCSVGALRALLRMLPRSAKVA